MFNKLHEIKPFLSPSASVTLYTRRDQIVLTRCRIGHTRLTQSFLFDGNPAPHCIPCDEHFSVKHFLLECQDLAHVRDKYFKVNTLNELFTSVPTYAILNYLKEINIYNKI